jgi:hypothetical protein
VRRRRTDVGGMVRGLRIAALGGLMVASATAAQAGSAFSCGGFAQLGGAQLMCSHIDRKAPPQICTFSWALMSMTSGLQVAQGSFLLPPGVENATVYQGSGFSGELSPPIVLCQAKKSGL